MSAAVYKWVDGSGQVHYGDQPSAGATEVELPESMVYTPPDYGDDVAQEEAGAEAVPKPVTAQPPEVVVAPPSPAPRASSTGQENTSGARESGDGTGAQGSGLGTGSGAGGGGQGSVAVRPSVRSGELNTARDFPIPEGGRSTRFGRSVTVIFTVTIDGRARNCSVRNTSVDAETTARVCPLVIEKIRFNPARAADAALRCRAHGAGRKRQAHRHCAA